MKFERKMEVWKEQNYTVKPLEIMLEKYRKTKKKINPIPIIAILLVLCSSGG